MLVVNKVGFAVSPQDETGRKYRIPYDNKPYPLPDVVYERYKEFFHVVAQPKIDKPIEQPKVEEKVIKKVVHKKTKPLKGVKLKKEIREKLRRNNSTKHKYY